MNEMNFSSLKSYMPVILKPRHSRSILFLYVLIIEPCLAKDLKEKINTVLFSEWKDGIWKVLLRKKNCDPFAVHRHKSTVRRLFHLETFTVDMNGFWWTKWGHGLCFWVKLKKSFDFSVRFKLYIKKEDTSTSLPVFLTHCVLRATQQSQSPNMMVL